MTQEAKVLTGIGIATLAIVIGAVLFFGGQPSKTQETQKITAEQKKILVREDSHKQEAKGAKITLVEFGDFQCPACGATYPIITKLLSEYKGKINFVFREYPIPSHINGHIGAVVAEAAGAQGKFFEMYDQLYAHQKDWGESKNPMDYFLKYAAAIKLDVDTFKKDIESKKYDAKIQRDVNDATTLGVNSTPTLFLNDEIITGGGLPYDEFKTKIDELLKK